MGEWNPDDTEFSTGAPTDDYSQAAPADESPGGLDAYSDAAQIPGEDTTSFDLTPYTGAIPGVAQMVNTYNVGGPSGVTAITGPGSSGVPYRGGVSSRDRVFGAAGHDRLKAILTAIWNKVGKKIALHVIVALAEKWGLPVAASAFGIGADDLTFLIAENAVVRRGRGRRGPHLHTILKRIRRGKHYEKMLRHWSARAGVHHRHYAPPAFGGYRRRRAHARRK